MYVVSPIFGRLPSDQILAGYVIQFTYSVVGYHGSGFITYREALAAIFLEGYASKSPEFFER